MANNRPWSIFPTPEARNEFIQNHSWWAKPVANVGAATLFVTPPLYVINHIATRSQLGLANPSVRTWMASSWQMFRAPGMANNAAILAFLHSHRVGLMSSLNFSVRRDTVVSNRSGVHKKVSETFEEGTDLQGRENIETEEQNIKPAGLLSVLAAAGIVSTADVISTNAVAAKRVLHAAKKPLPVLDTWSRKFGFWKLGIGTRWSRNYVNATLCLESALIQPEIQKWVPNPSYAPAIGSITMGSLSGVLMTAGDVLHARMVHQVDPVTLKAPSIGTVFKQTVQSGGYRALFRGSPWNAVASITAFGILNAIDKRVQKAFAEEPTTQTSNKCKK